MAGQCPFCGNDDGDTMLLGFEDDESLGRANLGSYVYCAMCMARGPLAEDDNECISKWNQSTTPEPLESIIERTLEVLFRARGIGAHFEVSGEHDGFFRCMFTVASITGSPSEFYGLSNGDGVREAVEAAAKKAMEGRDGA